MESLANFAEMHDASQSMRAGPTRVIVMRRGTVSHRAMRFNVGAITTATTFLGSLGLSAVLSRPASARSMAAWSRAYLAASTQPTPERRCC